MASKRVCAFCPETANLTGEHLYADWIDRILTTTTTRYVFTDINPQDKTTRSFGGRHLDRQFKAVCGDCNNTWMSDIDNDARNILKDIIGYAAPVTLLRPGLAAVIKFALKNAFLADYMHDRPFLTEYDRRQFKETLQIPFGTHIWLGAVAQQRAKRQGLY
jgi:hypothetical protein